jgi:nitroreductase
MALETLLIAAAEKKIDTCAIGGFIPEKYNEILQLTDKGLNACIVAAVGYRSPEDVNQFLPKVRIPEKDLFF